MVTATRGQVPPAHDRLAAIVAVLTYGADSRVEARWRKILRG